MQIEAFPRIAIENGWAPSGKYVLISIGSDGIEAKLPKDENRVAVLRLSFRDLDKPVGKYNDLATENDAILIWNLIDQHFDQIDSIAVNCEAGISRSAGVAAALSKIINGNDEKFFGVQYKPNMHVYRLIHNAAPLKYRNHQ